MTLGYDKEGGDDVLIGLVLGPLVRSELNGFGLFFHLRVENIELVVNRYLHHVIREFTATSIEGGDGRWEGVTFINRNASHCAKTSINDDTCGAARSIEREYGAQSDVPNTSKYCEMSLFVV